MSIRLVEYGIYPPGAWPGTIPPAPQLSFDMVDIAAHGMLEVIQTAGGAVTLHSLLDSLLVPATAASSQLTWLNDGVGVGTEMKRGFSGILGRFFARWYLETHHGLTNMVPISGEGMVGSNNISIFRTGQVHLPDWIALDPSGVPVLAESKGSHDKSNWAGPVSAGPLGKASTQLASAIVQMRSTTTGRFRRAKVKGWAVMSRWGTVQNRRPPLLYVLDPETLGHEMSEGEAKDAAQDIRRASLAGFMRVLGHPNSAARIASLSQIDTNTLREEVRSAEEEWVSQGGGLFWTTGPPETVLLSDVTRSYDKLPSIEGEVVEIADHQFSGRRFMGGIVDITGRLVPNNISEVLQGRTTGPSGVYQNLYFAGFDVAALMGVLGSSPPPKLSRLRVDRPKSESLIPAILALGDGFLLAPIEALSTNTEAAPAELTEPFTQ